MCCTLDFKLNLYSSQSVISTLAAPESMAALATAIGIVVKSLGSKIEGTRYSLPNSISTPL